MAARPAARAPVALVASVLAAVALAGCGGASPSASNATGQGAARAGGHAKNDSLSRSGAGSKAAAGPGGLSSTANAVTGVSSSSPRGSGGSSGGAASSGGASGGDASSRTAAVPILMYHVINPPPPGAPFPGLYVTREELRAQVDALVKAGFHAVTMDQMLAAWRDGAPLPARPIVMSFDNGYQSQYTNALPILRSVGWVGVENVQLTGLPPSQGGMSEGQVRGLVSAGWELDTQGFSHADLIALTPSELRYQVAVARREVQRRWHVIADWFCYPSGHYDAEVIAEVRAAGYVGSTTVVPGWATPSDDPYRLPRLRVLGGTSPEALLAQIEAVRSAAPAPPSYS